jgi:hypothetical protein
MEGPMAINIGRRKFVAVLGGTAFVRSFAARASDLDAPEVAISWSQHQREKGESR